MGGMMFYFICTRRWYGTILIGPQSVTLLLLKLWRVMRCVGVSGVRIEDICKLVGMDERQ